MIVRIVATAFIALGILFFFGAAVGLFRFPDFYARMHAAGKGDTLSSLLVILGFAIYQLHDFNFHEFIKIGEGKIKGDFITIFVILKLLAICAFIMITSPTCTHALMDAGWEDDIEPELKDENSNDLAEDIGNRSNYG